jgi:KUP system potassium uptake protein
MTSRPAATLSPRDKGVLCLGALGVVFGDIGTSPLYTMRECVAHLPSGGRTDGVLGVLSLIFWSLVLVVSVKYLWYVMTADNHGEGGIFALLALIHGGDDEGDGAKPAKRGLGPAVVMILVGAALLYGDGIITPAISVLGAAEGFNLISPAFTPFVPGMACAILAALFWFQHKGTKSIGGVFGPVMLAWFASIGILGACYLFKYPGVLRALNPSYGIALLHNTPARVATMLGSVVLAITGAEALYADMGHFGRRYIALAWYGVAFPGLVLNYFGQGAYILSHPATADNPFFAMAPSGLARAALTGISIVAAIIASQALISGAFSLTRQAIQLGYFPRLKVVYTNAEQSGQIYVPLVNTLLAIACILTAAIFGSSDRLASAYGIAVTGTMAITTVAYFLVARRRWKWPLWEIGPLCAAFLAIDLAFFLSNAQKLADGGWYPLAIAACVLAVMHTWKTGRDSIFALVYKNNVTETELTKIAVSKYIVRVPGAAIFMVGSPEGTPVVLLHHVKANRCLHENVILMCILTEDIPAVPDSERLQLREIGAGIWRANGHYGYMQSPDVTDLVGRIRAAGLKFNTQGVTYFFNREMILPGGTTRMWKWEKSFYGFLSRNARSARDYYQIPPSQIIEIGLPLQL